MESGIFVGAGRKKGLMWIHGVPFRMVTTMTCWMQTRMVGRKDSNR